MPLAGSDGGMGSDDGGGGASQGKPRRKKKKRRSPSTKRKGEVARPSPSRPIAADSGARAAAPRDLGKEGKEGREGRRRSPVECTGKLEPAVLSSSDVSPAPPLPAPTPPQTPLAPAAIMEPQATSPPPPPPQHSCPPPLAPPYPLPQPPLPESPRSLLLQPSEGDPPHAQQRRRPPPPAQQPQQPYLQQHHQHHPHHPHQQQAHSPLCQQQEPQQPHSSTAFDPIDDTAGPRPLNSPAPAGDSLAPGSDLAAPFPEGDSSSDSSGSEEDDEYDSVLRASDLYSPREYARRGLLEREHAVSCLHHSHTRLHALPPLPLTSSSHMTSNLYAHHRLGLLSLSPFAVGQRSSRPAKKPSLTIASAPP